jgi:hypothetical protein
MVCTHRYFFLLALSIAIVLGWALAILLIVTEEVLGIAERGYFIAAPKKSITKGLVPPSNFVVPEGFIPPKNIRER